MLWTLYRLSMATQRLPAEVLCQRLGFPPAICTQSKCWAWGRNFLFDFLDKWAYLWGSHLNMCQHRRSTLELRSDEDDGKASHQVKSGSRAITLSSWWDRRTPEYSNSHIWLWTLYQISTLNLCNSFRLVLISPLTCWFRISCNLKMFNFSSLFPISGSGIGLTVSPSWIQLKFLS